LTRIIISYLNCHDDDDDDDDDDDGEDGDNDDDVITIPWLS